MEYIELYSIAKCVREVLAKSELPQVCFTTRAFSEFPAGCCKVSAHFLMYYLSKNQIVNDTNMFLIANAEIKRKGRPNAVHAWAKVLGWHIDITGDQFGKESVIVSLETPWPDCENQPQEYPFPDVAPDFIDEFDYYCDIIKTSCN